MDKHSPLPWRLKELPTGDIEILDANGDLVHSNSMYYPTGISPADARLIIQSVNAAHDFARLTAFAGASPALSTNPANT